MAYQYIEFIVTRPSTGSALPGAKVTVYLAGTTTAATLFNAAGSGISNPVTADANGLVGFAAANGSYDFSAASADGSYVVPTIHRQQFYDLTGLDAQVTAATGAATSSDTARKRAANAVQWSLWTSLRDNATGMVAGDPATVAASDTGTHTDPVVGGTVNNAGKYTYSTSPAGWQRVADLDSQTAAAAASAIGGLIQRTPGSDCLFFGFNTSAGGVLIESGKDLVVGGSASPITLLCNSRGTPSSGFIAEMANAAPLREAIDNSIGGVTTDIYAARAGVTRFHPAGRRHDASGYIAVGQWASCRHPLSISPVRWIRDAGMRSGHRRRHSRHVAAKR